MQQYCRLLHLEQNTQLSWQHCSKTQHRSSGCFIQEHSIMKASVVTVAQTKPVQSKRLYNDFYDLIKATGKVSPHPLGREDTATKALWHRQQSQLHNWRHSVGIKLQHSPFSGWPHKVTAYS